MTNSGKIGEDAVCKFLKERGKTILERNFHSRFGEIDIIFKDGEVTVFVEVKTRKSTAYGTPAEFVTENKMKKIIKTAMIYLENAECDMRFDVAEVYIKNNTYKINYIENAFGGSYEIFSD